MLATGKGRVSRAGVALGVDSSAGRGGFPAWSRVNAGVQNQGGMLTPGIPPAL